MKFIVIASESVGIFYLINCAITCTYDPSENIKLVVLNHTFKGEILLYLTYFFPLQSTAEVKPTEKSIIEEKY